MTDLEVFGRSYFIILSKLGTSWPDRAEDLSIAMVRKKPQGTAFSSVFYLPDPPEEEYVLVKKKKKIAVLARV